MFEWKPEQSICPSCPSLPTQREKENSTGMPDILKAGVENLSGIDMSDVRVHYSSDKPADVGALAYTQGVNIHIAPGQERYLPHEAWHVVQQAQGRVIPIFRIKDIAVNDDVRLESEADEMGSRVETMQAYALKTQKEDITGISTASCGTVTAPKAYKSHDQKSKVAQENPIQCTIDNNCLNVVGEFHPISEGRRPLEIEFAKNLSQKTENCYWEEHEFTFPNGERANTQVLYIKHYCGFIEESLTKAYSADISTPEGRSTREEEREKAERQYELLKLCDTSNLEYLRRNIADLEMPMSEVIGALINPDALLKMYYEEAIKGLRLILGDDTKDTVNSLREERMHIAASLRSNEKGIWKVGNKHAIKLNKNNPRAYNVALKEEFDAGLKRFDESRTAAALK